MDFYSLFRNFFHISPSRNRDPFAPYDDHSFEGDNNAVFQDNFESFNPQIDMFKQMEDMFTRMFSSSFDIIGSPNIEENWPPQIKNPRQAMIKDIDDEICDSSCSKRHLGESESPLYNESRNESMGKSHSFFYSKFSSIRTVHLPDGTIEEHKTMIDNDGNKTTTVRRTIGDTSHEVTMKSDKQGIKEKEENFLNMDENELSRFEQRWNSLKKGNTINPEVPSASLPESNPAYLNLLKKFFGPLQKDESKWI